MHKRWGTVCERRFETRVPERRHGAIRPVTAGSVLMRHHRWAIGVFIASAVRASHGFRAAPFVTRTFSRSSLLRPRLPWPGKLRPGKVRSRLLWAWLTRPYEFRTRLIRCASFRLWLPGPNQFGASIAFPLSPIRPITFTLFTFTWFTFASFTVPVRINRPILGLHSGDDVVRQRSRCG